MFYTKSISKIAKLLLVIFLCSDMQSSVTHYTHIDDGVKSNSSEASFSTAKHHASIRLKEQDEYFGDGHICSGVVIGSSAILTTAHCVYNYNTKKPYHPSELKVVLATTTRYQRQQQALVYGVTHSYQPKTFNPLSIKDNVAILMLEQDIPKASDYVKSISLPQTNLRKTNWRDKQKGTEFKVTSWLKVNEGSSSLNHLMLLNATQVSEQTCLRYYGRTAFTNGMLCIESNEPLFKDFGAPLFVSRKLVGVRSFAWDQLSPAIYTDVSHHAKWIRSIIGNGSHQNSTIWGTLVLLMLTFVTFKRTPFLKRFIYFE